LGKSKLSVLYEQENLWVKKFIKKIDYSKEEISITLYYNVDCEKEEVAIFGSRCQKWRRERGQKNPLYL